MFFKGHCILSIIIFACYANPLFSKTYSFNHYGINDGLPSSEVHAVIQDKQGFMWFGTDRGVVRYDGHEFQVFNTNNGLVDNVVFHIYEDHSGRIWFASYSGQLCYYYENKFFEYKYNNILSEKRGQFIIYSFIVDRFNTVYFGVKGFSVFSIDSLGNYIQYDSEAYKQAHIINNVVIFGCTRISKWKDSSQKKNVCA